MKKVIHTPTSISFSCLLIAAVAWLLIGCNSKSPLLCELLIKNANIVDVVDGTLKSNQDVLIDSGKIIGIYGSGKSEIIAGKTINGTGKYLIPGLWDMHVHLADSSFLPIFLQYGVVGVRDMGGNVAACTDGCESLSAVKIRNWKTMIANGSLAGPEIYFSGPTLSGTGWPTSLPARNEPELQASLDSLQKLKVDFIKVYEEIPLPVYLSMSQKAKAMGLDFAGHLPEAVLVSTAAEAGQKSIEHVREALLLCFAEDKEMLDDFLKADNYSAEDIAFVNKWIADCDLAIETLKNNQTWLTPTLAVEKSKIRYADSSWIQFTLRKQMPGSIASAFAEYLDSKRKLDSKEKQSELLWWNTQQLLVKKMHKNGVGILAGTDASCQGGMPGYSLHEELQLLFEAGLSPLAALQAATLNPATYFNCLDTDGTVETGKTANLVLLGKNPLAEIGNTKTVEAVIFHGKALMEMPGMPLKQ